MIDPTNDFAVSYLMMCLLTYLWGICIGSFLNVCISRIPRGESVITPRSHCLSCGNMIAWYDNIPTVSIFLLGRKCRKCKAPISWRYLGVEFLTGVLFMLVWLKYVTLDDPTMQGLDFMPPLGLTPFYDNMLILAPVYWLGLSGLIFGSFVDIDHLIIPDRVSIGGIIIGVVLSTLLPGMQGCDGRIESLVMSVISALFGFGLLYAISVVGRLIFKREAMGFGDVKLMGAVGAFLGWRAVLFTLIVSSFIGAAVGLILVAPKKTELKGRIIPYGPFIAMAAILWMLWGQTAWDWYVSLMPMYVEELPYGDLGVY